MIKPKQIIRKYGHLKRGESMVYHQGYIARDRSSISAREDTKDAAKQIGKVASYFWQQHVQGKAHLFQKKINDFEYQYVVMKK